MNRTYLPIALLLIHVTYYFPVQKTTLTLAPTAHPVKYVTTDNANTYDDKYDADCNCVGIAVTCDDGIQNGDETDVDCGGLSCDPCPTCTDGIQNGNETDVDCGGPDCDPCPSTCTDGEQNGDETGIDCGGPDCVDCPGTFYDDRNGQTYDVVTIDGQVWMAENLNYEYRQHRKLWVL